MRINDLPWLLAAFAELGVEETPGPENTPRISEYLLTVGQPADDEIPWCAAFVNWCLKQCGLTGTGYANARSYLEWGRTCSALPGAIAVIPRGVEAWMGHVVIVAQVNADNTLYAVGGNHGKRVSLCVIPENKVLGYRFPAEIIA